MSRPPVPPWLIVVACSSGGLKALSKLVAQLPADLPASVLVASHTPTGTKGRLPRLLSAAGPLPASYPEEGQPIEAGRILIAPPDRHLTLKRRRIHLTRGQKEHGLRPAADVLFRSAARTFGPRSLGIVLSGSGYDGAAGLAAIRTAGGRTLIQAPDDAQFASMPLSALAVVDPDACAPAEELGPLVARLIQPEPAAPGPEHPPARQVDRDPLSLEGLRVFIAEDEYLIAAEIVVMLRDLGCGTVGPVADLKTGLRLLEQESGRVDCAVLDVDLRGKLVLPLAQLLTRWRVPFVFATGYGETLLPRGWADVPRLQKPYDTQALGQVLRNALHQRRFPPPEASPSLPDIDHQEESLKAARNLLMRSRALLTASTDKVIMQSHEAIRRTHECIATSARRKQATRRALRQWPPSGADPVEKPDTEDP